MNVPKEYLHRTVTFTLVNNGVASTDVEAKKMFRLKQDLPFTSYPVIESLDNNALPYLERGVLEQAWLQLEILINEENILKGDAPVNAGLVLTALDTLLPSLSVLQIKYALAYIVDDLPHL